MPRRKQVAVYQNIAFLDADPECSEAWIQYQYADAGIPGQEEGIEEVVSHFRRDP